MANRLSFMFKVAWKGEIGLSGMVLKRMVTPPPSKVAMAAGQRKSRVRAMAQGRPASTTRGSPWNPQLSDCTLGVTR